MSDEPPVNRIARFFRELKRRKVFRVITVYAGVAFIILQVCDLLIPALNLPEWTLSLVFVLLAVGFIIAVISAWAFEITPEGIVRISDSEKSERAELPHGGKPLTGNTVIITLLVIIIGLLVYPIIISSENPSVNTGSDGTGVENRQTARLGSKSIAVLPFTYLANEDSADYFSIGLTDELLSHLAKIEDLAVIGRTSVMQYRNTDKTLPEIGRELGVAHLLEGSVQVADDRVRIQAQLIESSTGTHMWADSYTLSFENILDLQSRVSREIVRELQVNLLPEEAGQLQNYRQQIDPAAYRLYLQGRYLRFQETPTSLRRSMELIRKTIEREPGFAPAYAVLSDAALNLWLQSGVDTLAELSTKTVEKALRVDSLRAEVQIAAGLNKGHIQLNYRAGIRHLLQAVQLNPGQSNTHRECGLYLSRLSLFKQALPYLRRATELDPVSFLAWSNLADNFMHMGMYQEAQKATNKAQGLNPEAHVALDNQALIYLAKGDTNRALEVIKRKIQNLSDNNIWGQYYAVYLYLRTGEKKQAEKLIQKYGLKTDTSEWANYNWARLRTAMGDFQMALNQLEKSIEVGVFHFPHIEHSFEPLHNLPRFRKLLERVQLDSASINSYREMVERMKM